MADEEEEVDAVVEAVEGNSLRKIELPLSQASRIPVLKMEELRYAGADAVGTGLGPRRHTRPRIAHTRLFGKSGLDGYTHGQFYL